MEEISTQELLDRILSAEASEMREILNALTERYSEVFPAQELLALPVPRHSTEAQIYELQKAIALLTSCIKK